jgi:double-GTPase-like protein
MPAAGSDVSDQDQEADEASTTPEAPATSSSTPSTLATEPRLVELPRAGAMLPPEASELAAEVAVNLVVLVGDAESGKSTLLSSIYVTFLHGPFGDLQFSGSRTLFAFEERSFLALAKSGIHPAATLRTLYGERQTFLHIAVSRGGMVTQFLIGDMSGEYFDRAVDNTDELTKLGFMRRADHVTVLIDGAQVVDAGLRHVKRARMRQLVKRMVETGLLQRSQVQIVITKWDCILNAGADAQEFAKRQADELAAIVAPLGKTPHILKTAARTDYPALIHAGSGVHELMNLWLVEPEEAVAEPPAIMSAKPFDRFRAE